IEPGLHGAQACLLFNITDLSGVRVGSGIMDKTCGMVFTMEVNGRTLKLLDTTYDISRNRLYAIPAVIIFAILWPVLMGVYLYIRKKYLNKEDSKEDIIDSIFLTGLASAISAVDIYSDVWFYAYFGFLGSILLHASVIVAIAVFCLLRGYKIKAIIPGIMELAFVFFITLNALGDTFAPHLTAFLGLSLSFYAMLWVVGYKKPEKESSKLDGIFSHIV
ncbi:MAG: hypothetical protein GY870_16110, partial [archaeon]|nr:hypothetical protein [archaeon]